MSRKTLVSALMVLFIVSIIPVLAEGDSTEVSLKATVVAPPETYEGFGYIFIEDQRAGGKAKLYIYEDAVLLEIYNAEEDVKASWSWNIVKHTTKTMKHLKLDRYRCEDDDGRGLTVKIYKYSWHWYRMITVKATGRGAFFTSRGYK